MSKLLPIITNPNPILRKKSAEVERGRIKSKEIQDLIADMKKTMIEKDGVGLAAPQIGQNIRLITINTDRGPVCLINPNFVKKSWAKAIEEEGCLSIPETFGPVSRHKKVCCKFIDELDQEVMVEAEGLLARALQHEIDHLDGILFIDKLVPNNKPKK